MRQQVLFVGNGLNRTARGNASWYSLLEALAGAPTTDEERSVLEAKPFTLWFEELACRKDGSKKLQEIIADKLFELSPTPLHNQIMRLGFQTILTTNYDHCLESASGAIWQDQNTAPETTYSLFRRRTSAEQSIWHLHGDFTHTKSILLGHRQYIGYMEKIRSYLTYKVGKDGKPSSSSQRKSKFSGVPIDRKYNESWVDIFLESDVFMLGFSLDYSENHLWHLITEKYRNRQGKPASGGMTFYRCSTGPQTTAEKAKLSLLNSFGVITKDIVMPSYGEAYQACLEELELLTTQ